MSRSDLHPPVDPYETGLLAVDRLHRLYWEQCGNPDGIPVVFLHGGPGSGSTPTHRRFFDPAVYRAVLFDQRGSGRSTPIGALEDNTTPHLISDMEQLRERLGIERWLVFGGSWGSTLALAYGQAHPERCLGFVLRGIFLCRPSEIDWFLRGMGMIFPEPWHAFRDFLGEWDDLLGGYYRRLIDPDPLVHLPAARAWSTYEGSCSTLLPSPDTIAAFGEDRLALGLARLEAHYMINEGFLPPGGLLGGIDRIRHLPAAIVQGRYDVVCPVATADALARAWPEADYQIVPDAGHSAMEPGTRVRLLAALDRVRRRLA